MQLTNEKKNSHIKKIYKFFINFIIFFFIWEKYFFNVNFLTKLNGMPKLNKFKT